MKIKRRSLIIVMLFVLAGLSLLLYPTVSNLLKTIAYHQAISNYKSVVEQIDPETYDDLIADAKAFNEKMLKRKYVLKPFSDEEQAEYNRQMVLPGTDVMGYVTISKINVSLPIYHGTSDAVLQSGVGHLEGSSLPVGGEGTHIVLSAHRGLPSAKLFTDLDQLVVGDTFAVRALNEVLTYEVDDIQEVLPDDSAVLKIQPGKDLCTLLTCTPYGVNTERMLVRGHRIPTPIDILDEQDTDNSGAILLLSLIAGAALLAAVVAVVLIRRRREKPITGGRHMKH